MRILYWLLPFGWMGIIFYSSAQPYEKQDIKPFLGNVVDLSFMTPYLRWISFTYNNSLVSIDELGVNGVIEFFIRKGAHFFVFFILLCLFYVAFKQTTNLNNIRSLIVSLLLTIAYAGIDEYHQGFTVNRTPYVGDVVIDSLGAISACMLIHLIAKSYQKGQ